MLDRCSEGHKSGKHYYDKGIRVCEEWKVFENFLADMGVRPKGKTLNRIKNELGYFKGNCEWSTYKVQAQTRTSAVTTPEVVAQIWELRENGISLSKTAKQLGINESVVKNVVYRGDWNNLKEKT